MHQLLHDLKPLILGNASVAYYVAAEFFALLALIVSLYSHSTKRDVGAPSTPVKFSWMFLIMDNAKRIFVGQITLFLMFRFTTEILGRELNMFVAVGAGFILSYGIDKAIQVIKEKSTFFQMNRDNLTTPPKD